MSSKNYFYYLLPFIIIVTSMLSIINLENKMKLSLTFYVLNLVAVIQTFLYICHTLYLFNNNVLVQANIFQWIKLTSKFQMMNDCERSSGDLLPCTMVALYWEKRKISTEIKLIRTKCIWIYVLGSKSFWPDQLFKVTEIKQLCYFST